MKRHLLHVLQTVASKFGNLLSPKEAKIGPTILLKAILAMLWISLGCLQAGDWPQPLMMALLKFGTQKRDLVMILKV